MIAERLLGRETGVNRRVVRLRSELPDGRGAGVAEARLLPPEEGGAAGPGPRPGRRRRQHPGPDPAGRPAEEGARPAGAAAQRQELHALGRRADPQHPRGPEEDQGGVARVRVGGRGPPVHRLGELARPDGRCSFHFLGIRAAKTKRQPAAFHHAEVQFEQRNLDSFFIFFFLYISEIR